MLDGRWMIGSAEKGAGAVRSTIKAGKMRIPPEIGWQYYDGADWKKDPLLTVTGEFKTLVNQLIFNNRA